MSRELFIALGFLLVAGVAARASSPPPMPEPPPARGERPYIHTGRDASGPAVDAGPVLRDAPVIAWGPVIHPGPVISAGPVIARRSMRMAPPRK